MLSHKFPDCALTGIACFVSCLFAVSVTSHSLYAQDAHSVVRLDPAVAKNDIDFRDQGEYLGAITTSRGTVIPVGLQIVALGNGGFQGKMYRAGLPGSDWDEILTSELLADRSETPESGASSPVVFTSKQHTGQFEIGENVAIVRDRDGNVLGQLPKIVRSSPTLGLEPPKDAVVLFRDGKIDGLEGAKVVNDEFLDVGFTTDFNVRDFRLHLEFRTPYMPFGRGQKRGNSGVYIQQRYETQVLDSFGLEGLPNECGGLYRLQSPAMNMAFPPLTWQTYDIFFQAAKFDDGEKVANARITVLHNGVAIHDDFEIPNKTGAGKPEGPDARPIHFQNHSDPVRFRNLWIVPTTEAAQDIPQTNNSPIIQQVDPNAIKPTVGLNPPLPSDSPTP